MNKNIDGTDSSQVLTWMVGISVTLLCLTGISALMSWIPSSFGNPADTSLNSIYSAPALDTNTLGDLPPSSHPSTRNRSLIKVRCTTCGVVESTRFVDPPDESPVVRGENHSGNRAMTDHSQDSIKNTRPNKRYETSVRFGDGSTRTFNSDTQPSWQRGDRIKVIDGNKPIKG